MRAPWFVLLVACVGRGESAGPPEETSTGSSSSASEATPRPSDSEPAPTSRVVDVLVLFDGAPAPGVGVVQGGRSDVVAWTGDNGTVTVEADLTVVGDHYLIANHPDARNGGVKVPDDDGASVTIQLFSFDRTDNEAYQFQAAGRTTHESTTNECAHCHVTITSDWAASPHRGAASNPHVQDVFAGSSQWKDEASCRAVGGSWWLGVAPGSLLPQHKCYVGDGALPALNADCGVVGPCDGVAADTGGCADCHAPAIDGALGGRDLLDATGIAFSEGVTCDVCHKVAEVDLDAPLGGVGGKLKLVRPSEPSPSPLLGAWSPLVFGAYRDVINPAMGAVYNPLFEGAELCGGCHQLDAPVTVPGRVADPSRWPDGRLPVQSTYEEWRAGAFGAAGVACPACHMPPAPELGNAADLYTEFHDVLVGISAGWERPPGAVRHHSWVGPRQPESGMLELAATVSVDGHLDGAEWVAEVTVRNSGAGHALPTGEPMRQLYLVVDATCDGAPLPATGGDAVPELGGAVLSRGAGDDLSRWPGARAGDVIRVIRQDGWREDPGPGPFGDGTFTGAARGLERWVVVGSVGVVLASGRGDVVLDGPLPDGDRYLLVRPGLIEDGSPPSTLAGASGFVWARVLVGADGRLAVPHFAAVDVVRDNRLMPGASVTTEHRFVAGCVAPVVSAKLVYRPFPKDLADQRGWAVVDRVIAEASR